MAGESSETLLALAVQLYRQGHSADEIAVRLRNQGAEDDQLQLALAEIKKLRHAKQRNTGFIWCGTGIFLLVAGCMLTIILHRNGQNIRLVMYSLTSLGIIVVFKGLKDVFDW